MNAPTVATTKPKGLTGVTWMTGKVGQNRTADDCAADSHGQRGDGTTGVAARHDGLRHQAHERAETDPDQQQVGPLLDLGRKLSVHA